MNALLRYFKEEFQLKNFGLQHPKPSDFYLSVWQTSKSTVPLLILRILILLTAICIVVSSLTVYFLKGDIGYWYIYLTHWGLTVMLLASLFATVVSARCYLHGPLSCESPLPCYVRAYWVLYNIAVPMSFLITLFYWTVVYDAEADKNLNIPLAVSVHGVNSLLMFLLLISSSQPSRLLHFYQPVCFALVYLLFGLAYFHAGGTDTKGNPYVYAVLDWTYPGKAAVVGALTGLLLVLLYLVSVAIAKARDHVSRKCTKRSNSAEETGMPLEQQAAV